MCQEDLLGITFNLDLQGGYRLVNLIRKFLLNMQRLRLTRRTKHSNRPFPVQRFYKVF